MRHILSQPKARVVPSALVFRAGIAETDDEFDGSLGESHGERRALSENIELSVSGGSEWLTALSR
jgi:hypothetical protein